MLQPKKVKYRKMQKGRMRGQGATAATTVSFGDFGLQAHRPRLRSPRARSRPLVSR